MPGLVVPGATSAEAASALPSALITRESKRFRRPGPTRTGPRTRRSQGVNLGGDSSGHLRPGRGSASGATARVARGELRSHALGSFGLRAAALSGVRAAALTPGGALERRPARGPAADSAAREAALPLGPARRSGVSCTWEPGAPKMRAPARELFRDPAFPASDSALFSSFSTPLAQFREDITWRRPQVSGWRGLG